MTYVLLQPESGECLGVMPSGRIDLVSPRHASRYDLADALKAQRVFGKDLDIIPASWLSNANPNPADAAELDALPRHGKGVR